MRRAVLLAAALAACGVKAPPRPPPKSAPPPASSATPAPGSTPAAPEKPPQAP